MFVSATLTTYTHSSRLDFGEMYKIDVQVQKGWNLIPYYNMQNKDSKYWQIDVGSDIKKENLKAIYVYSPVHNEYWRYYPEDESLRTQEQKFNDLVLALNMDPSKYLESSGVWIYSDKSGSMDITVGYDTSGDKILIKGWNFLTVTPDIAAKRVREWSNNCDVIKVYGWENRKQDWVTDDTPTNIYFSDDTLGKGFIIKVEKDCFIGSSNTDNPPNIPN